MSERSASGGRAVTIPLIAGRCNEARSHKLRSAPIYLVFLSNAIGTQLGGLQHQRRILGRSPWTSQESPRVRVGQPETPAPYL